MRAFFSVRTVILFLKKNTGRRVSSTLSLQKQRGVCTNSPVQKSPRRKGKKHTTTNEGDSSRGDFGERALGVDTWGDFLGARKKLNRLRSGKKGTGKTSFYWGIALGREIPMGRRLVGERGTDLASGEKEFFNWGKSGHEPD